MFTSVDTWYNSVLPPSTGQFAAIYERVLKQLGLSIYVPMAVGQLTRYFFEPACRKVFFDWKVLKFGPLCMLAIIWQTYDSAFASGAFDSVPGRDMIFIVFICLGMFVVWLCVAFFTAVVWLPKGDVIAVCYTVPAKGLAVAVPLSVTVFAGMDPVLQSKIQVSRDTTPFNRFLSSDLTPRPQVPMVIYQGLQVACGSLLIGVFRRWIAAEEARKAACSEPRGDVEMRAEGHEAEHNRQSVESKSK